MAQNSFATLDRLHTPESGAYIEKGRIGINDRGQLVVFKGKEFLLHLRQCHRADKFMKANGLSSGARPSLLSTLKFKDLRMGTQAVDTLIKRMRTSNTLADVAGRPAAERSSGSPYRSVIAKARTKLGLSSPASQPPVPMTTRPPMEIAELVRLRPGSAGAEAANVAPTPDSDTDSGIHGDFGHAQGGPDPMPDAVVQPAPIPKPRTVPPPKPPRTFASGAPQAAPRTRAHPAFIDDLTRAGPGTSALIRTLLTNRDR
uniref:Uncharacterized protein n=1 Tax=Pandoraea faecigallinarum TaxID=656179 RepID=A0A0H3WVU7_9BURK